MVGIKTSYNSHISNLEVYRRAGAPRKPSETFLTLRFKMLTQVYSASPTDPLHHVVFCTGYNDRIQARGRRRGGRMPFWIETTTHRFFEGWANHSGRGLLGPNMIYAEISRSLKQPAVAAPMRAEPERPRHQQKTLNP